MYLASPVRSCRSQMLSIFRAFLIFFVRLLEHPRYITPRKGFSSEVLCCRHRLLMRWSLLHLATALIESGRCKLLTYKWSIHRCVVAWINKIPCPQLFRWRRNLECSWCPVLTFRSRADGKVLANSPVSRKVSLCILISWSCEIMIDGSDNRSGELFEPFVFEHSHPSSRALGRPCINSGTEALPNLDVWLHCGFFLSFHCFDLFVLFLELFA